MRRPTTASAASYVRRIGPGLLAAALLALAARGATQVLPAWVAEAPLAVVAGLAVAAVGTPASWAPGLAFALRWLLRGGIVLLGAQLSIALLAQVGAAVVVALVALVALALALAVVLGRAAGVPPRLALLLGVGTAICGNTAIVTIAPVIGASSRETSYAVTTITVFGTVAVLLYPFIGLLAGMSEPALGAWAGMAVHDTSQVVATASAVGSTALAYATVVKLTRNVLIAPVVLLLGAVAGAGERSTAGRGRRLAAAVPMFVWGFLLLAALRSAGLVGEDLAAVAGTASRALILVALAALGLSTPVRSLPGLGLRPFLLGFALAVTTAGLAFAAIASGLVPLPA